MELQLQKQTYSCYETAAPVTELREESAETIVPDYCPDIARIVESSGCLLLRSREISDGRVSVTGSVKMTVLYMADGAAGLKNLDYTIPFDEVLDNRLMPGCSEARIEGKLASVEVRTLNPRKIFTRAELSFCLVPYCKAQVTLCEGVEGAAAYGIEMLHEMQDISIVKAVRQKDFTYTGDFAISSAKEPIREMLRSKICLRMTDNKVVSGKVLLKGIACVELLYLSESGKLCPVTEELPFSQIIDGVEDDGSVTADTWLHLTGVEVHGGSENDPDDPRAVSVKLFICAFTALYQRLNVCCVADIYSTSHELQIDAGSVELSRTPEYAVKEQSVREQLETGTDVAEILGSEVSFGSVNLFEQDGKIVLRTGANIRVLYLDEGGAALCAERHCEVSAQADVPDGCVPSVRSVCCGEISAAPSGNGIEIRFPVRFTVETACMYHGKCLNAITAQERQEDGKNAPSLVLKPLSGGEKLWDLAKQYRTTVDSIVTANDLPDAVSAAVGELLLIPRKR